MQAHTLVKKDRLSLFGPQVMLLFADKGIMKPHFQRMAAYNRWANKRLYDAAGKLPPAALAEKRSGFFPSILKTLNHILVTDIIWLGRLNSAGHPGITALDQVLHIDFVSLTAARAAMDERIISFVDGLGPARLAEDLVYRNMAGEPMTTPVEQVLAHVFNHQTHHRGQAHAMLSSTEVAPPSIDLVYFLRDHPEIAGKR